MLLSRDGVSRTYDTPISPHLTENDKGLYATMKRWRIDPGLYGDICNLHLRYSAALSLLPKEREEAERRLNQAARPEPTATGA